MDRSILLKNFKETFSEWIRVYAVGYAATATNVEWTNSAIQAAWLAWVASYETYAASALGHLTGDYNSQE